MSLKCCEALKCISILLEMIESLEMRSLYCLEKVYNYITLEKLIYVAQPLKGMQQ